MEPEGIELRASGQEVTIRPIVVSSVSPATIHAATSPVRTDVQVQVVPCGSAASGAWGSASVSIGGRTMVQSRSVAWSTASATA